MDGRLPEREPGSESVAAPGRHNIQFFAEAALQQISVIGLTKGTRIEMAIGIDVDKLPSARKTPDTTVVIPLIMYQGVLQIA